MCFILNNRCSHQIWACAPDKSWSGSVASWNLIQYLEHIHVQQAQHISCLGLYWWRWYLSTLNELLRLRWKNVNHPIRTVVPGRKHRPNLQLVRTDHRTVGGIQIVWTCHMSQDLGSPDLPFDTCDSRRPSTLIQVCGTFTLRSTILVDDILDKSANVNPAGWCCVQVPIVTVIAGVEEFQGWAGLGSVSLDGGSRWLEPGNQKLNKISINEIWL